MHRIRTFSFLFGGALLLAGLAAACGDDDSGAGPGTTNDGGSLVDANGSETGTNPGTDGGPKGDGGCTFASYVIGLVTTQTTATSTPDTTLGAQCTPSTTQDEFKSLFP